MFARPRQPGTLRGARARTSATLAAALWSLLGAGCSKGCKSQPYVPYSIGEDGGAATEEGGAAESNAATTVVPAGAKELTLEGTVYRAPEGGVLRAAFSDDVDLDGKRDAVFVVEKDKRMYVALYRGGAFQEFASELAVATASSAACDTTASIVSLHGGAFAADLRAACGTSEGDKPNRHVGIFLPSKGQQVPKASVHLALTENREQPGLLVSAESVDVDGDGTRDVRVSLKPSIPAAELADNAVPSASLVWLDRPTGFSPSLSEPESSLRASLDALRTRPNDAGALAGGEALRVLYGALCGTRPRLLSPRVRCDAAVSRVLAETEVFVGSVYATQKNPTLALSVLERADAEQLLPAGPLREQLSTAIRAKAPVLAAKGSRFFELPTGCSPPVSPAIGPLSFLPSGHLHVQGGEGSFDVDTTTGDKDAGSEKNGAFDGAIVSDKRERLLEVYDPCDGRTLRATIMNAAGDASRDLLLPVPGAVSGCGRDTKRSVRLLGQDGSAFHLLAAGAPVALDGSFAKAESLRAPKVAAGTTGGARSLNGAYSAIATSLGIAVQSSAGTRLWTNASLPPYKDVCQCTVRNDGKQVACATAQRLYVVEP